MIQSMTGYSRLVRHGPSWTVTIEMRSTNHRYLEIDPRMPEGFAGFEGQVVQLIKRHIKRGRIGVSVALQTPRAMTRRVVLDEALAHAYYSSLVDLKARFGLKGAISLDHLLALPQVIGVTDALESVHTALWPQVLETIRAALRQLLRMRRQEGQRLLKDIRMHLRLVDKRLGTIRAHLPRSIAQQRRRLRERLKALLGEGHAVTKVQAQEAVALIKDVDIHEELVRLESHLAHIKQTLESQAAVGKKFDFITQELMREANTMGAKANDAVIARHVIEIKSAIEKIREQVQNLE